MKRFATFVIIGAFAVAASLIAFYFALRAGVSPRAATVIRFFASLPILFYGYARFMHVKPARIALAVASSVAIKLLVEPVLTAWLLARYGREVASLSPLAGDFVYGPIATYTVLTLRANLRA
jgi:hypothetical protein